VTIAALGWRGGDRLTLTADAWVMIAHRDLGGMVTVSTRPYIVIPAALRARCGLRAGDHVLLAAVPGQDMLAAYSFEVVAQALSAHVPFPRDEGDGHEHRESPAGTNTPRLPVTARTAC
jgi:AbrB family looped-hinge helix DNA binding protein